MSDSRMTLRKRIIESVIADIGTPVLLEELRFLVFVEEAKQREGFRESPDITYEKSFNRTLRDHLDDIKIFKCERPERLPSGLVTRAAVFKIAKQKTNYINDRHVWINPTAVFACVTKWPKDLNNRSLGDNYYVQCILKASTSSGSGYSDAANFPVNQPISVISRSLPEPAQILRLAQQAVWDIFRIRSTGDDHREWTQSLSKIDKSMPISIYHKEPEIDIS